MRPGDAAGKSKGPGVSAGPFVFPSVVPLLTNEGSSYRRRTSFFVAASVPARSSYR
jgi:hypothetical protein